MRRLAGICLLLGCALISASAARAGGPVFLVVGSSGRNVPGSLPQASRGALTRDRRLLRSDRRARRAQERLLLRIEAEEQHAVDRFPAEDRAVQVQRRVDGLVLRADGVAREIRVIELPHYAASQYAETVHVAPSELQAGDLVFFEPHSDGPGHVGISVGGGAFIEAAHTGGVVKFEDLGMEASQIGYVGAGRPAA